MFRRIIFYDGLTNRGRGDWVTFLFWGLMSLLSGILILVVPRLLVVLIAAVFVAIGIQLLIVAFKARKQNGNYFFWRNELW